MAIPVKAEPAQVFGQISNAEEVQGQFGEQVRINLLPADPSAVNERVFFFKISTRANSKWIKFVDSFNKALAKAIQGAGEIADVNEIVGTWVKVIEVPRSGIVNGEQRDWTDPEVAEVYTSKENCVTAWETRVSSVKSTLPPAPTEPPATAAPAIPDALIPILKKNWTDVKGNEAAYLAITSSFGFPKEALLAAVK